jgi:hypothetical protein
MASTVDGMVVRGGAGAPGAPPHQGNFIARSVDAGGRPMCQYELCDVHAKQVAGNAAKSGRLSTYKFYTSKNDYLMASPD